MRFIDLHVHSTASDGTLTPTEVVERAIQHNLAAIALTDHDTVAGIPEALAAGRNSQTTIIPGIEVSCDYNATEIHVLGFYLDYTSTELQEKLYTIRHAREKRNEDMIALFQKDDIPITMELLQNGNPKTVITRAHFARVLMELGICKTKEQAFSRYIGTNCKYYLPKPVITPEYALGLITEAGGIPVLAHPLLYHLGYRQVEDMITELMSYGLKGVEAYHSSNNIYESDRLRSIALRHNLITTGGSDFHGQNKPDIDIGCGRGGLRITEHLLQPLQELRH